MIRKVFRYQPRYSTRTRSTKRLLTSVHFGVLRDSRDERLNEATDGTMLQRSILILLSLIIGESPALRVALHLCFDTFPSLGAGNTVTLNIRHDTALWCSGLSPSESPDHKGDDEA